MDRATASEAAGADKQSNSPVIKSSQISEIAPYWRPDGLALPQRTRSLAWNRSVIDPAAIWFIERLSSVIGATTNTEPQIDLRRIPDDILTKVLDGFADAIGERSVGNFRSIGNFSGRFGKIHSRILPRHAITDDILLVAVPMVGRSSHSWDDPEANTQSYLVFRRKADACGSDAVWALFPRSLRHTAWNSKPSTLIRKRTIERLTPLWRAAIDALPPIALTRAERKAGGAALFGALIDTEEALIMRTDSANPPDRRTAFWRAASGAARTLACARGVTLSPPPRPRPFISDRFTWGVFTDHIDRDKGLPTPTPVHRVKISWNGWDHLGLKEDKPDSRDVAARKLTSKSLASIEKDMAIILNRMAPAEDPLFFDKCRYTQSDLESGSYIYYKSCYEAPTWNYEDHPDQASRHETMRQLASLPADWRKAVVEFL